nr:MAG TPA: Trm112p-like protein [Caudoviricetes sp.]
MHDSSERRLCRECRHTYAKIIRALPAQTTIVRQIAYKQVRLTHLGHTPSRGVPPMPLNTRALKLLDRIHAQCCVVLGQVDARYASLPLMPALRILGENVKRVPQLPAAVYDLREWRAIERDYDTLTTPDEIKHPIGVCPKCNAPAAAHTWDKTYTCEKCGCSSIVEDMKASARAAVRARCGVSYRAR